MKTALIIFVRNPEAGKVKTRLAATMGTVRALDIYCRLLQHTHDITRDLACDKFVFYADNIAADDLWENHIYQKKLQRGDTLGDRMLAAFIDLFKLRYAKVQVIGSDCFELSGPIIETGFDKLNEKDVVIGPSADGGYYLLGTNQIITEFFSNKQWSSETVFADTLSDMQQLSLTCFQLPVLRDVDTEDDWNHYVTNNKPL